MKNSIVLVLFISLVFNLKAQECTNIWPYVYTEFQKGVLYMPGDVKLESEFNIHVQESKLHYIENGIIKEAQSEKISLVKIGNDLYMNVEGQVMKVIGSDERGFVATLILGDFDKLYNSGGAYGSSSNSSSVTKLSSIEIGGKGGVTNVVQLQQRKNNGEGMVLPLKHRYFLVTKGKVYRATRKGIMSQLDKLESARFKKFLKSHKIKWSDTESLLALLDFFNK